MVHIVDSSSSCDDPRQCPTSSTRRCPAAALVDGTHRHLIVRRHQHAVTHVNGTRRQLIVRCHRHSSPLVGGTDLRHRPAWIFVVDSHGTRHRLIVCCRRLLASSLVDVTWHLSSTTVVVDLLSVVIGTRCRLVAPRRWHSSLTRCPRQQRRARFLM